MGAAAGFAEKTQKKTQPRRATAPSGIYRPRRPQASPLYRLIEDRSLVTVEPEPEALQEAKRRWAQLLRRIFEVDPSACPRCGEEMRIISFITEPKKIDRILEYLRRRTESSRRRQRAPPRRWKSEASKAPA